MGMYLAKPNTEQHSERGSVNETEFGMSCMQGWRKNMEDAHVIEGNAGDPTMPISLFGVFDGHGGPAVATWTGKNFVKVFRSCLAEAKQNIVREVADGWKPEASSEPPAVGLPELPVCEEASVESPHYSLPSVLPCELPLEVTWIAEALQRTFLALDESMAKDKVREEMKNLHFENQCRDEEEEPDLGKILHGLIDMRRDADQRQDRQNVYSGSDSDDSGADGEDVEIKAISDRVETVESDERAPADEQVRDSQNQPGQPLQSLDCQFDDAPQTDGSYPLQLVPDEKVEDESDEKTAAADRSMGAKTFVPYTPECCGTTGVVAALVYLQRPYLIVANAGDSRAVVCRNNEAIAMSLDHKPGLTRECQRIYKAGGSIMNGRVDGNLNLSRAIGDLMYKSNPNRPQSEQRITSFPDVYIMELSQDDKYLVLACDGIWDCMSNQELAQFIDRQLLRTDHDEMGMKLQQTCQSICSNCVSDNPVSSEGLGCDNMTVMIAMLDKLKIAKTSDEEDPKVENEPLVYAGDILASKTR